ncbi:hypothetical protein ACGFZP_22025 [Kitasatospora sp. NPDC048239]|uniref:hypothetical protein n=1 Tax=Kitasatospora sp. NPDC048239 TaxID=3364046 RepID=UPI00371F4416
MSDEANSSEVVVEGDLRELARAFLVRAFAELTDLSVLPASAIRPFLRVGHDYAGGDVMGLPEFKALERALEAAFPARFDASRIHPDSEFSSTYILSLLQASIARCAVSETGFEGEPAHRPMLASFDEMLEVLRQEGHSIACCRAVSHVATEGDVRLELGRITIIPGESAHHLVDRAREFVPALPGWFNADLPFFHAPPHALIVAGPDRGTVTPEDTRRQLSVAVDRFLLLARLLYAGTPRSGWEVSGASTLVSGLPLLRVPLDHGESYGRISRVITLSADDEAAFNALGDYLDAAVVKRDGMVVTSFDMALIKYQMSHEQGTDFERLVDLATALEAVLTGGDKDTEAVSLRLRSRAAALLSTPADSGTTIFQDIGRLYGLRSTLVHGGSLKESDLRRQIMSISTVQKDATFGTAVAFAVDRLRDLVRRSILARLCLASGPDPLWPFTASTAVDAALADDATRTVWRDRWRGRLAALNVAAAAEPARPGLDPLSPETWGAASTPSGAGADE